MTCVGDGDVSASAAELGMCVVVLEGGRIRAEEMQIEDHVTSMIGFPRSTAGVVDPTQW